METVLVVGSTGNIGVSAVTAALRSNRKVLAIVRNQASADKLVKYVGSGDGITFVEADVTAESGVKGVVDQVRAGKLPSFQHVYSAVGGPYAETALKDLSTSEMREHMRINFESNFFAYRDTIGYLLEKQHPNSTWTICTGAQGELGVRPAPGMSQGALFTMATSASLENEATNVRFNEIYLSLRVEVDEIAAQRGNMKSSEFGKAYEGILSRPDIRGCRVSVHDYADLEDLKFKRKAT